MINNNPLISIITPVYNAESTIKDCIASIQNQTYSNWEMICINDGSTDNCANILDFYASTDSRIKVIHKPNGGVSSARNIGLQNISKSSKYTHFVDADDYISPDAYESIIKAIANSNIDIDCVRLFAKLTNLKFKEAILNQSQTSLNKGGGNCSKCVQLPIYTTEEYFATNQIGGMICNLFIKSDIAKSQQFDVDLNYMEDQLFSLSCALKSKNIAFFQNTIYYYYQSEVSTTHSKKDLSLNIELLIKKVSELDNNNKFFNTWFNTSFVPVKANMIISHKIRFLRQNKKVSPLKNTLQIFHHLTLKNKIYYLILKVLSTFYK